MGLYDAMKDAVSLAQKADNIEPGSMKNKFY